jgi:hypothetical protein
VDEESAQNEHSMVEMIPGYKSPNVRDSQKGEETSFEYFTKDQLSEKNSVFNKT